MIIAEQSWFEIDFLVKETPKYDREALNQETKDRGEGFFIMQMLCEDDLTFGWVDS